MNVWATGLARWETAHQPTRLRADRGQTPEAEGEGYECIERLFEKIGKHYLGFAWRHTPFARLRDHVDLTNVWVVRETHEPVGSVFAHRRDTLLHITVQALQPGVDAAGAIAAVVSQLKSSYLC